jgi:hypothetical protein
MPNPPSVLQEVFEAFLNEVGNDPSVEPHIAERLRQTLTSGEKIDADALRRALFAEDDIA